MSATLSAAAREMLARAGYSEVADDYLVDGDTDITILLCDRAVRDLNRQASKGEDAS